VLPEIREQKKGSYELLVKNSSNYIKYLANIIHYTNDQDGVYYKMNLFSVNLSKQLCEE